MSRYGITFISHASGLLEEVQYLLLIILEIVVHELCPVGIVAGAILYHLLAINIEDHPCFTFVPVFESNAESDYLIPAQVSRIAQVTLDMGPAWIPGLLYVTGEDVSVFLSQWS